MQFNGVDKVTFDNVNGDGVPGIALIIDGKRWLVYFDRAGVHLYIDDEGSIWDK